MSDLISKTELKDYLKCWLAQAQYYHEDEKNDMIPLASVMAYIKACKVQEPFINKPCVSEGACQQHTNTVLDKIRAEITEEETECPSSDDYFVGMKHGLKYACKIIDKHRAESKGVLKQLVEEQNNLTASCKAWGEAIDKAGYVN